MIYKADLHIHSCLSPCGSLDMSPRAIVERAKEIGLNCLALTDHNTALNCAAVSRLCERAGLLFFPGLEVTTAEEAHVVCLFGDTDAALELGRMVYEKLPPVMNKPEKFGDQVIVNEDDEIEDEVEKYLVTACGYNIDELRDIVTDLGGLFIAAHVDKPCFSVPSQLGMLCGKFDAVEVSRAGACRSGVLPPDMPIDLSHTKLTRQESSAPPLTKDYAVTSASDSHYLHTMGSAFTEFTAEDKRGFAGLRQALQDKSTRLVIFDRAFRTAPGQRTQ